MPLTQLIYTSTCTEEMTPKLSHQLAEQSVKVCDELSITGRVFANDSQALAITEGATALVYEYYDAVKRDPLVESIMLHVERPIEFREFWDYSVWLNAREHLEAGPHVKRLTRSSLAKALPTNPSGKIRIMVDGFLKPELFAA